MMDSLKLFFFCDKGDVFLQTLNLLGDFFVRYTAPSKEVYQICSTTSFDVRKDLGK